MDEIVKQAMSKWPNVPACFGWLGLDARGHWFMRDERTQAMGDFVHSKGSQLRHEKLIEYIGRNYMADPQGRWYFQNGPQQVFVELEATPWVWRVDADGTVRTHTGLAAQVQSCWVDEQGKVYLSSELGFGLLQSHDVAWAAHCIEAGIWKPQECLSTDLPRQFGYQRSPQTMAHTGM
ncbi:MAG: DUF2946 family protein [Betaproteobacteria bacterium]|nr:DUF2946 family protein [Betaproteobacteria bacterium]